MKIEIEKDHLHPEGERITRLLLSTICQELGLDYCPSVLKLKFFNGGRKYGYTDITAHDPYIIFIKKGLGIFNLIITLAHEMVHVRDVVTGLMQDDGSNLIYRGKKIDEKILLAARLSKTEHLLIPHEQEPYTREWLIALAAYNALPPQDRKTISYPNTETQVREYFMAGWQQRIAEVDSNKWIEELLS